MAVHHAVGISRQRNSGYRPSGVNIMAQGLSTPDPSLSPTHLSIRRGHATTAHHQVSLMVSCNTTPVPSLGLCIGPACEAGLSAGMRRECVSHHIRKKERKKKKPFNLPSLSLAGSACALYVLWTRTASEKVAVAMHHLHLNTLCMLSFHCGGACGLGHLNWPQHCSWQI